MGKAMINGQSFSFADAKLIVDGFELFSIDSITATITHTKTNNPGAGAYPTSRGRERKEYSVSFSLALKDVRKIKLVSRNADLTNRSASIASIILDNEVDGKHRFDLIGFEWMNDGIDFSGGDAEARMDYECICADIISNHLL